jgi:hypothetical protein
MTTTSSASFDMKTHFSNRAVPPVTAEQLRSVGVDPSDLWWSPTFNTWAFAGDLVVRFPYSSTGHILTELGLTPDPRA